MFFSSSTILVKDNKNTSINGKKIITYILVFIWVSLLSFAVISLSNPKWLVTISEPGKNVEASSIKEYGDLELRKGNHEQAIGQYLAALKILPNNVEVLTNLGIAFGQIGMKEQAIETFKKTIKLKPKQIHVVYYNLAQMYEQTEQSQQAIRTYILASEKNPFPYYSFRKIGKIYYDNSDWDNAIVYFEKALKHKLNLENSYIGMLKEVRFHLDSDSVIVKKISSILTLLSRRK